MCADASTVNAHVTTTNAEKVVVDLTLNCDSERQIDINQWFSAIIKFCYCSVSVTITNFARTVNNGWYNKYR